MLTEVYLGLGSNLGDREATIRRAVALIGERVGRVTRQSSLIETEPWGFQSDHPFLNAVVCCQTPLSPRQLLAATQAIERELGRQRKTVSPPVSMPECPPGCPPEGQPRQGAPRQYADRPIDIDILLFGDMTVDEPDLKIPHPLMSQRDFVMVPLREIQQQPTSNQPQNND